MGSTQAIEYANMDLDQGLAIHLTSNHYPPVPVSMIDACKAAINAYWEEDYERLIDLPSPIKWKDKDQAPARAIVDAHHLDAWVDRYDEWDE